MRLFDVLIFVLLFFSATAQTADKADTTSYDTIENSNNHILIEYKIVNGVDTQNYYREVSRCPILKAKGKEDEMIQYPNGATFYLKRK